MTRQTIREYTSEQVPMELLNIVLDAAIRAPSGRNTQPCHLRVLRSKEMLDEMNTDFKNIVGWDTPAYTGWDVRPVYHNAPTFIFIFAKDKSDMAAGLMAENIALSAKSLGLGSCMVGSLGALFDNAEGAKKWKKILGLCHRHSSFYCPIALDSSARVVRVDGWRWRCKFNKLRCHL